MCTAPRTKCTMLRRLTWRVLLCWVLCWITRLLCVGGLWITLGLCLLSSFCGIRSRRWLFRVTRAGWVGGLGWIVGLSRISHCMSYRLFWYPISSKPIVVYFYSKFFGLQAFYQRVPKTSGVGVAIVFKCGLGSRLASVNLLWAARRDMRVLMLLIMYKIKTKIMSEN